MSIRTCALVLFFATMVGSTGAQEMGGYSRKNTFSVFSSYSNDSSHIFLGITEGRKLLQFGAGLEHRLLGNSIAAWGWEVDVLPVALLRNVYETHVETVAYFPGATPLPHLPAGTYPSAGLTPGKCVSPGSFSVPIYENTAPIQIGTLSFSNTCSYPWTYGAGVSPLGQVIHFRPKRRFQPYLAANAGFLEFTEPVPDSTVTRFNFTFEGGAGLEWYLKPGRSVVFDFRYHHISNAHLSVDDPGIDNAVFKVGYTFGR